MKVSAIETLVLPVSERIRLVTEIWDTIAEFPNAIELTPSTRNLLEKRLSAFRENPNLGSAWHDSRRRIIQE